MVPVMRTGFDMTEHASIDADTMRVVVSVMRVLTARVIQTAFGFAKSCGRDEACGVDMKMALKYQAMTFFRERVDGRL